MVILLSFFHYLNATDNITIIFSFITQIATNLLRGFSTNEWMFYLSAVLDFSQAICFPPIRSQISKSVSPHELGKVYAMLSSVESLVPIITTLMFTRVYTATRVMDYPLSGMCYFICSGCFVMATVIVLMVATSLRCGHIPTEKEEKEEVENSMNVYKDKINVFSISYKKLPNVI